MKHNKQPAESKRKLTPEQRACFDTSFTVEPRKIEDEQLTPEMRGYASALRKKGLDVYFFDDAASGKTVGIALLSGKTEDDAVSQAQWWIHWYILNNYGDFDLFEASNCEAAAAMAVGK